MLKFFEPHKAIGLEVCSSEIKGAEISLKKGKPFISSLFSLANPNQSLPIKQLSTGQPLIVTGLDSADVLIRPLYIPIIKEKDLDAAFVFQAEPHLPYPTDQAILTRQTVSQTAEGTHLTLMSVQKNLLQKHLDTWQEMHIEPEQVACIQSALCQFGSHYFSNELSYLVLHLSDHRMTCILMEKGKLLASYTHQEGFDLIRKAHASLTDESEYFDQINFSSEFLESHAALSEAVKKLQQSLARICSALIKDYRQDTIQGILVTGEAILFPYLEEKLTEKLNLPLLHCPDEAHDSFNFQKKQNYAVPIGLALGALENSPHFRQQEFSYPHPWRRVRTPVLSYLTLIIVLTAVFYLFSQAYLRNQEDQFKQEYVDLLLAMNKSYDQFEQVYLSKNPAAKEKNGGDILPIEQLNHQDLLERMEFLYKDLQAMPDSFPLFANVPRVSDVLAWLSTHPLIVHKLPDGTMEPRLQLENFNYSMVKRPGQGKKQEKYQIKVELEFSSPTPTWAREFHDSLITLNDFVDPKGEVKWSSNRGRYKTSFYLKDKTSYNQ